MSAQHAYADDLDFDGGDGGLVEVDLGAFLIRFAQRVAQRGDLVRAAVLADAEAAIADLERGN